MARAHTLSLGRGLDLCQSALPWQDAVHVSNSIPPSHSTCDRAGFPTEEQQGGADRLAHAASVAGYIADLKWGECEGHAIATSPHHSKDDLGLYAQTVTADHQRTHKKVVRMVLPTVISAEVESAKRRRKPVGILISTHYSKWIPISNFLGAWGCPKRSLPKSAKCLESW